MEEPSRDEAVRCASCGCEYELPQAAGAEDGCPDCGEPTWILLALPVSGRKIPLHMAS